MRINERSRTVALCTGTFVAIASTLAFSPTGCTKREADESTYFNRSISPVLVSSCVRTNTGAGCHVESAKGNAFGNLDVATFAGVNKRRDLLVDYGPYGQPAFLIKTVDNFQVQIESFDGTKTTVTTDIKHTGGSIFQQTGGAYTTVRRWIENGATENNTGEKPANIVRLPCSTDLPESAAALGADLTKDPTRADFSTFRDRVNPVFKESCAASNCHGVSSNELYLTCGDSPEQLRWNYHAASEYLSQVAEQSEIVRRPLAPSQGGSFHEGGALFSSQSDPGYIALSDWAKEHGPTEAPTQDSAFLFFAHRVQPVLVKKGCMMLQCHSAALFHDYRLRGGSGGSFSLSATRRNHELSLHQVSLESDDPAASRMIRKNLFRAEVYDGAKGIAHRGGSLLEDFQGKPASSELCDAGAYDYEKGNLDAIPAYCIFREWIKREKATLSLAPLSEIAYVRRSTTGKGARPQDFDVYSPGSDLRLVKATLAADSGLSIGAETSATTGCGLDSSTADIRRPAVSWDGKTVAFAARGSAAEPLAIYTMNADGSSCAKHPAINAGGPSANGLLIHNFDPTFGPTEKDGTSRIVFASTRGNASGGTSDYEGPQRTPADPTKSNANLYSLEPDTTKPGATRIRQLTFLLNMERQPSFMADGRIILTAEKRAPGFYQLAGRRINADGGDYHPLYAQRSSIGYHQLTDIVELADKNIAGIFSDAGGPHGGGVLGIVNRSLGIDFKSNDPRDYPLDPSVIDPAAPASIDPAFFLRSLRFPDAGASGRVTGTTTGVYRSPAALPSPKLLVSYGAASSLRTFGGDYDVYLFDPETGEKTKLFGEAGAADIEAVAVYGRASQGIFTSALDEPNGHTRVIEGRSEADITYLDVPVLASLLFQNTPTGRTLENDLTSFQLYEDLPPPLDATTFAEGGSNVAQDEFGQVYVRRRLLGTVPIARDGSAHVAIPGGLPVLFRLPDTKASRAQSLPRFQRESSSFAPGEYAHQSFQKSFFNGLCGQCHGAISGRATDVAVQPDILTQASRVIARDAVPINLNVAPNLRGTIEGPSATP
jgi:hypothetical protein